MPKAVKIKASAHYVPERVVTNDELSNYVDTSDEWIQKHTGIKERRYAIGENTSDLCAKAAKKLLDEADIAANEIDLIIVATISPDSITPATATLVQQKIDAVKAFSFDISVACAGFIFALSTAEKFLRQGNYKNAIVIAGEVNSKMMDFSDRTSAVFFGDGAGGVLLSASDNPDDEMFIAEKLESSPAPDVIHSGRIAPISEISTNNYPKMDAFYQDGRAVYEFVTSIVPEHIDNLLKKTGYDNSELELVITHQANLRLIENIALGINVPLSKFEKNIEFYGNTSSAGIAIGLDRALKRGERPHVALITGFGGGLSYGSILLDLSRL
ncbi:beta-ketoacyl-ACP synthase III [Liquorilactobacillus cacaonum]|uniref:Beta-ketoacyl-[acyl-carrier-protein] synthase III n=1 Tax=Liquorilactobacillus cacaonum DSM 21116 TaxID=1423729 RepID=A0A0R2CKJ3_9LACO|nr:beta-ketoacyl-ACP synthase III [Liquorilactobacillus cacaonum]KRM90484.1 3-oxoacyl-(acyl carrier protein) synthase III [Liquorilactobacillus cacaonum DSM 21116]